MRKKNDFWMLLASACALAATACSSGEGGADHDLEWELLTDTPSFTGLDGEYRAVVFKDRIWLVNGEASGPGGNEQSWNSADGVEWTPSESTLPSYNGRSCLVFNGKLWAFFGFNGEDIPLEIMDSGDGLAWNVFNDDPDVTPRARHGVAEFDGKMWIIGGIGSGTGDMGRNDVWSSGDGEDWDRLTESAAFSPRYNPGVAVHDGKLWVIGGGRWDESGRNDVWWSTDGASWTLAVEHAAFPARSEHAVIVHDGAIWVIGGYGADENFLNDAWWSADGREWRESAVPVPFSPRRLHEAVDFDGSIWVIGGRDEEDNVLYDVWRSR